MRNKPAEKPLVKQGYDLATIMRKIGAFRNRPYRVVFIKGNGERREMLCINGKYAVKFIKGAQPKTRRVRQDRALGLRTVFDLEKYQELRKIGQDVASAGQSSWRRIDLNTLLSIEPVTA